MKNTEEIHAACREIDRIIYDAKKDLMNDPFEDVESDNIRYLKAALVDFQNSLNDYIYYRSKEMGKRAAKNDRFYLIREDKELNIASISSNAREFEWEALAIEVFNRYNLEAESGKQRLNPDRKKYILYKWDREKQKLVFYKK